MAIVSSSNGLEKRPKLRFPGFNEPYKQCRIGDVYAERSQRGASDMELLSVTMNDGVMPRSEIEGKDNSSEDKSNYKVVLTGDMVYNSMRMWQGANGISPCDGIVSPAYTVLMPKIPISNGYFAALFKSPNLINKFRKNSQGMTSDTWNLKYPQIETIKVSIPSLSEQEHIADMLGTLEKRIAIQAQLVDSLKKYKRGLIKDIFTGKLSLSVETPFDSWETRTIKDCLIYEQPQKYIVETEKYDDTYTTPVLTANKAFILGYTNEQQGIYDKGDVIIYDDFTMDMKYVTFNFKVKSSTIKMLTPTQGNDLYFMYALLQSLDLQPEGHQRSYISKVEMMSIKTPPYNVQLEISNFLKTIDARVVLAEQQLECLVKQQQGFLQALFV